MHTNKEDGRRRVRGERERDVENEDEEDADPLLSGVELLIFAKLSERKSS